jgi:hypothetical protein
MGNRKNAFLYHARTASLPVNRCARDKSRALSYFLLAHRSFLNSTPCLGVFNFQDIILAPGAIGALIMSQEAENRLQGAIRLEHLDNVPVAPMIYYFAANYAGITMRELWSDWAKYESAIRKCYRELGPWEIYYNICPVSPLAYQACLMMKVKYPGKDLPQDGKKHFFIDLSKIHIITIMEQDNIHRHAFVLKTSHVVYETLNEALDYLEQLIKSEV